MKRYDDLVVDALNRVKEATPWDFGRRFKTGDVPLLLEPRIRPDRHRPRST